MNNDALKELFDQQAEGYDKQWEKTSPIRDALLFLMESVFAELPATAHLLCIGAGTGAEISYLAARFPRWRFTAVEPSIGMVKVCRRRAQADGFADRCQVIEGYVEAVPERATFDGATCLLVSQFLIDQNARTEFFRGIHQRLLPSGLLVSSDLASDIQSPEYDGLLRLWLTMMSGAGITPEALERLRKAYSTDVAVLPPEAVTAMIAAAGFTAPTVFYQAGLIHGWFSRKV